MREQSEQLFNAIYQARLCAMLFLDTACGIREINGYGAEILGSKPDELAGKCILEYIPEEEHASIRKELDMLLAGRKDRISLVHRFSGPNGTFRWVSTSVSVYPEADGSRMLESVFVDITNEKNMEEHHQKSLEIMDSVASIYDAFYFCDMRKDTYQRLGERTEYTDTLGIPKSGILSETVESYAASFVTDEYRSIFRKFLDPEYIRSNLTEKKNSYEFEYCQAKNGRICWKLGVIVTASRDTGGLTDRFCMLIRDIEDMKMREAERMKKSQLQSSLTSLALDSSDKAYFIYNIAERSIDIPKKTCERVKCKERYENMPDSFRGSFVHPDSYAVFNEIYEKCNRGIDKARADICTKDGAHWYSTTLYIVQYDEEHRPVTAVGIIESTDELHRAKSEAEALQDISRFAVKSHYEVVNLIDVRNQTYSFFDFEEELGDEWNGIPSAGNYSMNLLEKLSARLPDEEDRKKLPLMSLEKLVPYLKEQGVFRTKLKIATTDGERWKLIESSFFQHDTNRIIFLISDIQDEEAGREQLKAAMESAQEANQAKSAFLANMSHEIRTPMNTIIGISEILMNRPLSPDVLNDISMVQNAASGLLTIINDILDFSKIESGRFELTPVDYMLPSLLMDINNIITVQLADRPIYFLINVDHKLPNHLFGDDIRIKQVLMNLLGNAVKFTKEGFIELRVNGEPVGEDHYRVVFRVIDSGIGIRKEDIGKLFGTFSQVDTTKNRAVTGSGLGLAISRSFSEMMGGGIKVESEYGKGTAFTVEIMQEVKAYEPIGDVLNKDVRILVCENDEIVIDSISRTLENLGLPYSVCRDFDKVRTYQGMTHVIIRRNRFFQVREKLNFMFEPSNIFLLLENNEQANGDFMQYKQLQLPLMCMQIINALNGERIASSYKRRSFDRSQIIPLTFARVLLVDDNVTNLQVAKGLMAPYKMTIDAATSGFKAIELVKKNKYDLIFMDHMMPEMDGVETTQHIRDLPGEYYRKVPIIALTANAVSDAKETFLSGGMDDFLAKPIEMTELHRILKHFVLSKAPEDYVRKYMDKNKVSVSGTSSSEKKEKGFPEAQNWNSGMLSSLSQGGSHSMLPVQPEGSDSGLLGQLLCQNNSLLTQNMMLLQHIFRSAGSFPEIAAEDKPETAERTISGNGGMKAEEPAETKKMSMGSIPGVDMGSALQTYGGSFEIYNEILRTYAMDIGKREISLKRMVGEGDVKNFTISVHAIKSASRGIGAGQLGDLAADLEKDGKAGDWNAVLAKYPAFSEKLHEMAIHTAAYAEQLPAAGKDDEREERADFSAETVEALKAACRDLDYSSAEEKLDELDRCQYPDHKQKLLEDMLACCGEFEYEKLDELVRGL
ncbi:MAG TPA: ATP-binding protein [Lachnospiraceae bacterium]|nr:ATP-binding protein [Lachnospiraceae bacterium]